MRILFVSTIALMSAFFCGSSFADDIVAASETEQAKEIAQIPETPAVKTDPVQEAAMEQSQAPAPAETAPAVQEPQAAAAPSAEKSEGVPPVEIHKAEDFITASSVNAIVNKDNVYLVSPIDENKIMFVVHANDESRNAIIVDKSMPKVAEFILTKQPNNPVYVAVLECFTNSQISDEEVQKTKAGFAVISQEMLEQAKELCPEDLKEDFAKSTSNLNSNPIEFSTFILNTKDKTVNIHWSEEYQKQYAEPYKKNSQINQALQQIVNEEQACEEKIKTVFPNYDDIKQKIEKITELQEQNKKLEEEFNEKNADLIAKNEEVSKNLKEKEKNLETLKEANTAEQEKINKLKGNQKKTRQAALNGKLNQEKDLQKQVDEQKAILADFEKTKKEALDEKKSANDSQIKKEEEAMGGSSTIQMIQSIKGQSDKNNREKFEEIIKLGK